MAKLAMFSKSTWQPLKNLISSTRSNITVPYCTAAVGIEYEKALPYSQIPGPNLWQGLLAFKDLPKDITHATKAVERLFNTYGPMVKQNYGLIGIVTMDANIIEAVYRNESKFPTRIVIESWRKFRDDHGLSRGLLTADDEHWWKMRRVVDRQMLRPLQVTNYTDSINAVTSDFIERLRHLRDTQGGGADIPKLDMELYHWSFESICTVLFERRLHCFDDNRDPEIDAFVGSIGDIFEATNRLIFVPYRVAQVFLRSILKRHNKAWEVACTTAKKMIDSKMNEITRQLEAGEETSGFLSTLLDSKGLTTDEIYGNVLELMGGAVDTTSNSMQWMLYELSRNPEALAKLEEEIFTKLPDRKNPSYKDLDKMHYLKAVIKETLRMYPVTMAVSRYLPQDMVLNGFQVPKGTLISMFVYHSARDPKYFPNPNSFIPDRWLRGTDASKPNAFAALYFGHGTRMCVGRRVAELEMQILLIKLLDNFHLRRRNPDPIEIYTRSLIVPEHPVDIQLIDRQC